MPASQGGKKWYPTTVKAVVTGQDAATLNAAETTT